MTLSLGVLYCPFKTSSNTAYMSWCRDGDLRTFVSGEFDVISTMGNICNGSHGGFCPPGLIAGNATQVLDIVQLIDVTIKELIVLIRNPPTRSIYIYHIPLQIDIFIFHAKRFVV